MSLILESPELRRTSPERLRELALQYHGQSGFNIYRLNSDSFVARAGNLWISTLRAKDAFDDWSGEDLKEVVGRARNSYNDFWASQFWRQIPRFDNLDESSCVDIVWIFDVKEVPPDPPVDPTEWSSPDNIEAPGWEKGSYTWDQASEGLTMRTVEHSERIEDDHEDLAEDLRFSVGPGGRPLLDIIAERFYQGDIHQAAFNVVAASRLAPVRTSETSKHNKYTPEAFAGLNLASAFRSAIYGKELYINTMIPSLEQEVLMLPSVVPEQEGITYRHTPAEVTLALMQATRFNRNPESVDGKHTIRHLLDYPGYFLDRQDLAGVLDFTLSQRFAKYSDVRDLPNTPLMLVKDLLAVDQIHRLHPSEFRDFALLLNYDGTIIDDITGDDLRRLILATVGDGAQTYLMDTETRFTEALKVLAASPSARKAEGENRGLNRLKL